MNIKLIQLQIENFKGLKSFVMSIDGENAVISGANGTGKTTVYDAFLWLLFGKDSSGRKDFELRPLDDSNQPIKGLVLSVAAEISFDGTTHVLKKEHREKLTKDEIRGYETFCWINDVPKKVSEYAKFISDTISEDVFKLLTDLHFFNDKMHWTDRRAALLDIAGKIGTPKGFDVLLSHLNGRAVVEYAKVLAEQKKKLVTEQKEINPRIDEIQRGLTEYAGQDTAKLEIVRNAVMSEIAKLDSKRSTLFAQEKSRQANIEAINSLKSQRIKREHDLLSDTSSISGLLSSKNEILQNVSAAHMAVAIVKNEITTQQGLIRFAQTDLEGYLRQLDGVREEYKTATAATDPTTCFNCNAPLPANKLAEQKTKRDAIVADIVKRGDNIKTKIIASNQNIEAANSILLQLNDSLEKAQIIAQEAEIYKVEQFEKIDAQIANRQTTPPEQDKLWMIISNQITKAETELGEPVSERLEMIDQERTAKTNDLKDLNNALAQADSAAKAKVRIEELEQQEKTIASQINDIDSLLADIDSYKSAESRMIEAAVNSKFKHVTFKLFNELLNGSIEETCEAMLNGVPYSDMSCGQKILVGIDIINVLSAHYQLSVPIFIDNAESLTLPNEAKGQVIELYAKKNVKKMIVSISKAEKAVA